MTADRGVPAGLGDAGAALWLAVQADVGDEWELTAVETDALERACRCADELAELEAAVDRDGMTVAGSRGQLVVHPALSEARQLRLVQLRLLSSLALPDEGETLTAAQRRARAAAQARWGRRRGAA